jgi:hypothetical protein
MRKKMTVVWSVFILIVGMVGCAGTMAQEPPPMSLPKDAVLYTAGARETFDRIVQTLEKNGYETEVADRQSGLIRTRPKMLDVKGEGPLRYTGFYVVQVGPRRGGSFAIIHFAVLPEIPGEREKLLRLLEQGGLH